LRKISISRFHQSK